ncbi:MAG: glycosyltransferase [Balneolaceae bacterium]
MKSPAYKIAFFGSSLVSAYWNGAATYYRGIIKALHQLGHQITFFEPDAFQRQQHRDIPDPGWAEVVVYQPTEQGAKDALARSRNHDIVVKASGVGVNDSLLEKEVLNNRQPDQKVIFWDVDAPATLESMRSNPGDKLKKLIPDYDLVFTYGGGRPVIDAYEAFGAKRCVPVNNALDPDTHHPTEKKDRYVCDLAFLGNRLPDREERMNRYFFSVADSLPDKTFILGGSGWESREMSDNIRYLGHIYTNEHNAFNVSPKAVLNINRDSMAEMGFSPATRVFEAAGAGACIITDAWEGLELFLEPGEEVLVAHSGEDVIQLMQELTREKAAAIGKAALNRVLASHTYRNRAKKVVEALQGSAVTDTVTDAVTSEQE